MISSVVLLCLAGAHSYAPHFVSASIFEDGDRLVCDVAGKRNWGNWPPAHLARAHQADCGGDLRHALAALDAAGAADGPTPPTVPRTAMHPVSRHHPSPSMFPSLSLFSPLSTTNQIEISPAVGLFAGFTATRQ